MARMHPDGLETFGTGGEKGFYHFLRQVARPDDRCVAWYNPRIGTRTADFILYTPDVGLIVFEVKDWMLTQIREADPNQVVIDNGGRTESHRNPLLQAMEYKNALFDELRRDRRLLSTEPGHAGKLRIPVHHGVVFPNINRYDLKEQTGLAALFDPGKAFLFDDLHPLSDLCADPSGQAFRARLAEMFPPFFPYRPQPRDAELVGGTVFPEVRLTPPDRPLPELLRLHDETVACLDDNQVAVALTLRGGRRLVTGPPGSGKTLVLVHRAALLRRYDRAARRILFLCYNVTLVQHVRRLLAGRGLPTGEQGIEVMHFFELCNRFLDEPVLFEKEDAGYYDTAVELTTMKLAEGAGPRWDAVLVDEAQDLSEEMLAIAAAVLREGSDHLLVALDEAQDLYHRERNLRAIGIDPRKAVRLPCVYRNSVEILSFARPFTPAGTVPPAPADQPSLLLPAEHHGPEVEIVAPPTREEAVAWVADWIAALKNGDGIPLSQIAVLYPRRCPDDQTDWVWPAEVSRALESRAILSTWVAEDYRAKKAFDVTTEAVAVSTIHSAKGLDWACVFLVGADLATADPNRRNIIHVGATRARWRLFVADDGGASGG